MYTGLYQGTPVNAANNLMPTAMIDPEILSKHGTGFLEESPGNRSCMRLMCMMALISAIVFGGLTMMRSQGVPTKTADGALTTVYPPRDDTGLTLTFGFLIAAFAPKAVQKFAEQRLRPLSALPPGTVATVASALPGANALLTNAVAAAAEDPRFSALQQEIAALRAKLTAQQVQQPAPPSSNGTALTAPVPTPLQQIRLGDSL